MTRTVPYDGKSKSWEKVLENAANTLFGPVGPVIEVATEENVLAEETVKPCRIRILLSRPLTWAEKEDLETNWDDPQFRRINGDNVDGLKLWVAPNFEHVWAEANVGSRLLFEDVANVLANDYVNVFPKAVRTFREYNGK